MPFISYKNINISSARMEIIEQVNIIHEEYVAQNLQLSLRQLYYQFVQRDLFPDSWKDKATGSTNNLRSYSKLGDIIGDGRMAGLVDWEALEDRGRYVRSITHYESADDMLRHSVNWYAKDMWENQPYRPEVWIEKDALLGVVENACNTNDVPYFSCRGYTSLTEMWKTAQRFQEYQEAGQTPIIFHLGDHDPSGIDMSRDIFDRLATFMGEIDFERLALNINQIQQYAPPPNPAKMTDSRFRAYITRFGESSWELDALNPTVVATLITNAIDGIRDVGAWNERVEELRSQKAELVKLQRNWGAVSEFLDSLP